MKLHRRCVVYGPSFERRLLRSGMAPLEFVMALPVLLALTYAMLIIFKTFEQKLESVTQVRYATFRKLPSAIPKQVLQMGADVHDGATTTRFRRQMDWGSNNYDIEISSGLVAISGTWDASTVPFSPATLIPQMHTIPAEDLVSSVPGGATAIDVLAGSFALLMNVKSPPYALVASIGSGMNITVRVAAIIIELSRVPLEIIRDGMQLFLDITFPWRFKSLRKMLKHGISLIDSAIPATTELPKASRGIEVRAP